MRQVALVVNFVLGSLVTLGIGSYEPSLVLFSREFPRLDQVPIDNLSEARASRT